MRNPDPTPADAKPSLRLAVGHRRALARGATLLLACSLMVACGASGPLCVGLLAGVLLATLVERWSRQGDFARRLQIASRAARAEGQRDSSAQVMSLQLAYERTRSVLEALREGVLVVDEGGEIVLANPAACHAMQASALDPIGQVLWEVLTPELAVCARAAFEALRDRDGGDEQLPQIRYSGIPCRDGVFDLTACEATSRRTGQEFGMVFLLVDGTRSYELQRIKDRFLSNVSHELRTPLTNICAYAEILSHLLPGESAEWPEFVRVIHEEGVQLSSLVDSIFDYLQLESGDAQFVSETVDGADVVSAVVAQSLPKARARGIELELEIIDQPPLLLADRRRLDQLARQLLDNAIKFSPVDGRVRVTVAGCDDGWQLRVDDNGPGVPEQQRLAVFEKFSQLQDQLTDKPAGTGIGLATSRAIATRFGGLIRCEQSELGGASFLVWLPALGQAKPAGAAVGGTAAGSVADGGWRGQVAVAGCPAR